MTAPVPTVPFSTAPGPTALVVSAHAADFVWRASGAIALHAERGMAITVVCLSFGERGESAKLWRQPGMTLDLVKAERRVEAEAAAAVLGVHDLQFWDLGDQPITLDQVALFRMAALCRALRPAFILTHGERDLYNFDHPDVGQFTQRARLLAQAHGHDPDVPVIGAPPVYAFEPQQPEQSSWRPDLLLDITRVWPRKRAAIECIGGQQQTWEYHTRVSQQRGTQAARNSARPVAWAEGFQSVFPRVATELG